MATLLELKQLRNQVLETAAEILQKIDDLDGDVRSDLLAQARGHAANTKKELLKLEQVVAEMIVEFMR